MPPDRKHPCPPSKQAPVDEALQRFNGQGYKEIQRYVKEHYGFTPKTCWIADRKEELGFRPKRAWNRGK